MWWFHLEALQIGLLILKIAFKVVIRDVQLHLDFSKFC
jgi:hypothetical protein